MITLEKYLGLQALEKTIFRNESVKCHGIRETPVGRLNKYHLHIKNNNEETFTASQS